MPFSDLPIFPNAHKDPLFTKILEEEEEDEDTEKMEDEGVGNIF